MAIGGAENADSEDSEGGIDFFSSIRPTERQVATRRNNDRRHSHDRSRSQSIESEFHALANRAKLTSEPAASEAGASERDNASFGLEHRRSGDTRHLHVNPNSHTARRQNPSDTHRRRKRRYSTWLDDTLDEPQPKRPRGAADWSPLRTAPSDEEIDRFECQGDDEMSDMSDEPRMFRRPHRHQQSERDYLRAHPRSRRERSRSVNSTVRDLLDDRPNVGRDVQEARIESNAEHLKLELGDLELLDDQQIAKLDHKLMLRTSRKQMVTLLRRGLLFFVLIIEKGHSYFNPDHAYLLSGWSEQVMTQISSYDPHLERIYDYYFYDVEMHPVLALSIALGSSAIWFAAGRYFLLKGSGLFSAPNFARDIRGAFDEASASPPQQGEAPLQSVINVVQRMFGGNNQENGHGSEQPESTGRSSSVMNNETLTTMLNNILTQVSNVDQGQQQQQEQQQQQQNRPPLVTRLAGGTRPQFATNRRVQFDDTPSVIPSDAYTSSSTMSSTGTSISSMFPPTPPSTPTAAELRTQQSMSSSLSPTPTATALAAPADMMPTAELIRRFQEEEAAQQRRHTANNAISANTTGQTTTEPTGVDMQDDPDDEDEEEGQNPADDDSQPVIGIELPPMGRSNRGQRRGQGRRGPNHGQARARSVEPVVTLDDL